MKKIVFVGLTVITLLASCASTDLKPFNNDLKNPREITENQDKTGIDQIVITYYVKGVGGSIASKSGIRR